MSDSLVIIPTYNEKENIERIIRKVFSLDKEFNVLVVEDNSPDGTAKIVHRLMDEFSDRLFILERKGKLGLGTAYIAGFKYGLDNESRIENVSQITHTDGHLVYIQYSLFTIRMDKGFRLGLVVRDNTSTVLSQQKIAAQNEELSLAYVKMEKLARIDPLTQLANRRDIEIRLSYEKRRVARHRHSLSIAIGDIDDFKHFNDAYGHDMGDFVLVEIARIMSEAIREQDIIGRWGGEEFILVFPETPADGCFTICNRLRESIEKHNFDFKGESLNVKMTIGLSEYRGSEKMSETIKRADVALYQGKKSGKNCVVTN